MKLLLPSLLVLALLAVASSAPLQENVEQYQVDSEIQNQPENKIEMYEGGEENQAEQMEEQIDSAPSEQGNDEQSSEAEAQVEAKKSCESEPEIQTKKLGGKTINQATVKIQTAIGCKRVLEGGTSEKFTLAGSCSRCWKSGPGMQCTGSGVAMSMSCDIVLGPDCRMYSVDQTDPTKACE